MSRGPRLRFDRRERLTRRSDFQSAYSTGRRFHGALFVLFGRPNALGHPRLGLTASRKIGVAAERNRVKRRLREIYRHERARMGAVGMDVVVNFKERSTHATFDDLRQEFVRGLSRLSRAVASTASP